MTDRLSALVADVKLPRFVRLRQKFSPDCIEREQVPAVLRQELSREAISGTIRPGMRVCITCGSRGIDNYVTLIRTIADFCKEQGAEPFAIPTMGSHGCATAEGQRQVLEALGITEESIGCPILSSMDTVVVGQTSEGKDVHVDAYAAASDAIIVVNRIKPHTSFRGTYESGMMKMMAIGLGKQRGADSCHGSGYKYMAKMVPAFGKVILEKAPVVFGVAVLENAFDKTARIHALTPQEIIDREPELLKQAFKLMPRLYFDSADVLIVDEIGKNISGGGMDPNISGAFSTPYASGGLQAQTRCILSLTPQTHGSAYGMGAADVVSKRLYDAVDFEKTYPNSITSTALGFSRLPIVMKNDLDTIRLCIKSCTDIGPDGPRVIRIRNTLALDEIWISEAMIPEAMANPNVEILSQPEYLSFNDEGNLA